jgi:hypothetical protein
MGRRVKLRPELWAKLWAGIARNDAQIPWVKPGRFLSFPEKMASFSMMSRMNISFGYLNV